MPKLPGLILAVALLASPVAAQTPAPASALPAATQASARAPSAVESEPLFSEQRRASRSASATSRPAGLPPRFSSIGVDLSRMFLALGIVLAIIGALYWLVRRYYGGAVSSASTRAVKVLSRTSLSPRQQVMLLQVGKRVIVVGDSGGAMNTLAQFDDADEVATLLGQLQTEQMNRAASFGSVFHRNQKSFDDADAPSRPLPADPQGLDPADVAEPAPADELAQQRSEIAGLLEKVRSLRGQIGP